MRVLISGSSGFVGSNLCTFLESKNHEIFKLVRSPPQEGDKSNKIFWNPRRKEIDEKALEEARVDAVIHLAGENIGNFFWTDSKRKEIKDSRTLDTSFLVSSLSALKTPPKVFLSASGIAIYGKDRKGEVLVEGSEPEGDDGTFLLEVSREWENAARWPEEEGRRKPRVCFLRLGVVLGKGGGALSKMVLPFKMGVGGRMGSGEQGMSWIGLADVLRAVEFLLEHPVEGAVNLTSPSPVSNSEFSSTLAGLLWRPCLFPLPEAVIGMVFGDMGRETILADQRVIPKKLMDAGFEFEEKNLEGALKSALF